MGLKENDLLYSSSIKTVSGNATEVADSVYILSPSIYENHFTKFLPKWEEYNIFDIHVMHGYYYLKKYKYHIFKIEALMQATVHKWTSSWSHN